MPSEDLLKQNVVVNDHRANHYFDIDLSKYNIPFGKNGLFIAMEWLNLNDKKYLYEVNYPKNKKIFYGQQIGITHEFDDLSYGRQRINGEQWKSLNSFSAPRLELRLNFTKIK